MVKRFPLKSDLTSCYYDSIYLPQKFASGAKRTMVYFLIFSQIILGSIFFYEAFLEIKGTKTLLHLFCDPCNIKIITELTPAMDTVEKHDKIQSLV